MSRGPLNALGIIHKRIPRGLPREIRIPPSDARVKNAAIRRLVDEFQRRARGVAFPHLVLRLDARVSVPGADYELRYISQLVQFRRCGDFRTEHGGDGENGLAEAG